METGRVNKETRAFLLHPTASSGRVLLAVYPDIIKTQAGADFYVGQRRLVVERVVDHDAEHRNVYLKQPSEEAQP